MAVVYIGIGSNLGDRRGNCLRAVEFLESRGVKVTKRSSMYETEPWGVLEQPTFINMAVEAETDLSPHGLLSLLKEIEREMGREEALHWGPRLIDLDLLFYGDLVLNDENLTIPHPLLQQRDFVLEPLSEIAPEKVHPVLAKTVTDLLRARRSR